MSRNDYIWFVSFRDLLIVDMWLVYMNNGNHNELTINCFYQFIWIISSINQVIDKQEWHIFTFRENKAGFESWFPVSTHMRIWWKTRLSASDDDCIVIINCSSAIARVLGRLTDISYPKDLLALAVGYVEWSINRRNSQVVRVRHLNPNLVGLNQSELQTNKSILIILIDLNEKKTKQINKTTNYQKHKFEYLSRW